MSQRPEKLGFLSRTARLLSRKDRDIYADIHFEAPEPVGDEATPALECPSGWSAEAAAVLAEALCRALPARTRAIEENTVPSWLWRRAAQGTGRTEETGARQIFDRAAGSAVYAGWKQNLFSDEADARAMYDELRALLIQRLVAFEPAFLASLGLDWAYGLEENGKVSARETAPRSIDIPNTMIDALVRGTAGKALRARRQKLWPRAEADSVTLRLSDIAGDWGTPAAPGIRASLDLLGFRHNDGWVNVGALRHAVRLIVILLDLHGAEALEIGFHNLAPLLMALALPYDSAQGRSVAAAISAIISAEAYATSAELAGLRGPSAEYLANRETVLRSLRNRRRAAYGDRNDYEKISVLPAPLLLEHAPDLALVATAQRRWEDALQLARQHGLRQTQVTTLFASPALTVFAESAAQGAAPMAALTLTRPAGPDLFRREADPSIAEALTRLNYDKVDSGAVLRHIAGSGTLDRAPAINHAALRAKGFDEAAIARVEDYLCYANDIRLAFTPWILGEDFCRKKLKIPAAKLANPRFELLKHLGFSAADIAAANAFVYGHGIAKGAHGLRQAHAAIFARGDEIAPEARIRMAAAVQSFISGDAGLEIALPANSTAEKNEALLLAAWRQGVKSLRVRYDVEIEARKEAPAKRAGKKDSPATFLHTQPPAALPARRIRPKAGSGVVSLRGKHKSAPATRDKRR